MGRRGSHRNDTTEEWAIRHLSALVDKADQDRDCLPGSVVKLVKQARVILKKRRKPAKKGG